MRNKISNQSEIMLRQIHPKFLENGEPASDRFRPSERDANMLSVDRSSIVTAAQSHNNYTKAGLSSAAVFGLSVAEFRVETIDCLEDPIAGDATTPTNPAHALADYSPHTSKKQKLIAKRLKRAAVARGRLHPPPDQN
jgi:hypothetical protein